MKVENVRQALRAHIVRKYGSQRAAADAWAISAPMVSQVLRGDKTPTKAMLDDIGVEAIAVPSQVRYVKKKQAVAASQPKGKDHAGQ